MTSSSASTTAISSPKPVYYLGLDLTPEALRGVVVDDALDVVVADCVLFENNGSGSLSSPSLNPASSPSAGLSTNLSPNTNSLFNPNLSQIQTQSPTPASVSSSPAPAPTLAISTILAALDLLLSKLASRTNLAHVRSISGSTFAGTVFYQSAAFASGGSDSFGGVLNAADNAGDTNATTTTLESLLFPSSISTSSPSSPSSSPFFALPIIPTPTDTSTTPFAQLLQDTHYGSAGNMAAQCGTSAFAGPVSGLAAAQMMKLRVTMPEVWQGVDAVSGLGAFLVAVLTAGGGRPSPSVADALASGLLDYGSLTASTQKGKGEWEWMWNLDTVRFVAGVENDGDQSENEVRRVLDMIGGSEGKDKDKEGYIAGYFVKKYGFGKETTIHTFTSTHIATYLSLVPTSSDAVLSFGTQDAMIMSTPGPSPSSAFSSPPHPLTLTQSFPHPAQTQNSAQDPGQGSDTSRKWISILTARNGDVPRMLARDMYTKSWSAFDRLVAIVPPGGSIGLDDKLFSFWFVQPEYESTYVTPLPPSSSTSTKASQASQGQGKPTRGIYRFENGTKANEFRDLRANPRCLIEGQIMGFRTRFGRVVAASSLSATNASANANLNGSVLLNGHHNTTAATATTPNGHSGYTLTPSASSAALSQSSSSSFPTATTTTSPTTWASSSPSLPFSPYTSTPLPKRIFATGSASYFPSIVNVVGEVFNCPVFVPQSVLEEGVVWAGLVTALQQGSSGSGSGPATGTGEEGVVNEKKDGEGQVDGSDVGMLSAALARIPSRAGIGGAYLARWGWKRVSGGAGLNSASISTTTSSPAPSSPPTTSFEDDIRWLLAKRWAQAQSVSQYQGFSGSVQHPSNSNLGSGFGLGFGLQVPGAGSGTSSSSPFSSSFGHSPHGLQTPTSAGSPGLSGMTSPLSSYLSKTPSRRGLHRAKSNLALASEIVVEEDEEEEEEGAGAGGEVAGENVGVVVEEGEEGVPRESGVYKYPIPAGVNISSSSSLLPISPSPASATTATATHILSQTTSTTVPSLSLTTTNPSVTTSLHQPGPLTSLIGPLPTPVPLTSTLHPIAPLMTNDADAQFGLVKVAEPDEDAFVCYASMLFEWVRLEGGVWDGIW